MPIHSYNWRIAATLYSFYWDVVIILLHSLEIGNGKLDFMRIKIIESTFL